MIHFFLDLVNKKTQIALSNFIMVRVTGVEPASLAALDPKSSASANSAIPAWWWTLLDSNQWPPGYEPDALTNWAKGPRLFNNSIYLFLLQVILQKITENYFSYFANLFSKLILNISFSGFVFDIITPLYVDNSALWPSSRIPSGVMLVNKIIPFSV